LKFRTIVADPPWKYKTGANDSSGAERTKSSAELRYSTMTTDDIAALRVAELADTSAHLWLWGTNMKLGEAYKVVAAWGFEPLSLLTWAKTQPGVGHYLRNNTEHCILAVRGKPMPPRGPGGSPFMASYFVAPRERHSAKPDRFYDVVEQVSPGPYVELFARTARMGWERWGDEVDSTVSLASGPVVDASRLVRP
jgi:N6-adenosine-specific RNA methylase IME4